MSKLPLNEFFFQNQSFTHSSCLFQFRNQNKRKKKRAAHSQAPFPSKKKEKKKPSSEPLRALARSRRRHSAVVASPAISRTNIALQPSREPAEPQPSTPISTLVANPNARQTRRYMGKFRSLIRWYFVRDLFDFLKKRVWVRHVGSRKKSEIVVCNFEVYSCYFDFISKISIPRKDFV